MSSFADRYASRKSSEASKAANPKENDSKAVDPKAVDPKAVDSKLQAAVNKENMNPAQVVVGDVNNKPDAANNIHIDSNANISYNADEMNSSNAVGDDSGSSSKASDDGGFVNPPDSDDSSGTSDSDDSSNSGGDESENLVGSGGGYFASSYGGNHNAGAGGGSGFAGKAAGHGGNTVQDILNKQKEGGMTSKALSSGHAGSADDTKHSKADLIYLVKGIDDGRNAWYYVLVERLKLSMFLKALNDDIIHLEHYGEILDSAYGDEPPQEVTDRLKAEYGIK